MKKKQNFETTLNVTSTYAGEAAAGYISASLLSASTLDAGLVTIHENVKYKQVLQVLDASSLVTDASCDFTPGSSVAITEVVLEPKALSVQMNLCKSDFLNSWESMSLGMSAWNNIPASLNDFLISYIGGKIAESTENSIWNGSAAVNGEFNGIVTDALANEDVVAITGSTITSENVVDVLTSVYDAIPAGIYGKADLKIFVSQKVAKLYQKALSSVSGGSYLNMATVDAKPNNFLGVEIAVINGLEADTIVATTVSNLHFATGLLNDTNQVKVLDMSDIDGSDNFRVIFKYTADAKIGVGSDVVLYTVGA